MNRKPKDFSQAFMASLRQTSAKTADVSGQQAELTAARDRALAVKQQQQTTAIPAKPQAN